MRKRARKEDDGVLETIVPPSGSSSEKIEFRVKAFGTVYELDRHIMHSSLLAKYVRITLDVYKAAEGQLEESGFLCERDICTMKIEKREVDKLMLEILPILDEMRKRRALLRLQYSIRSKKKWT